MHIRQIDDYIKTCFTVLIGKLLAFGKLSLVVGSYGIMFSASNVCLPLVGLFGGIGSATAVWTLLFVSRLVASSCSVATLAFYLPGYCAALYLATASRLFRCGLPLLAIILFCVHPVGSQAMLYSLYWLIPLAVGAGLSRGLFAQALGATFTAHAVGSVIWLYAAAPMAPAAWLALMPLVALERVTFAAGMIVMHHATNQLMALLSTAKISSALSVRS